MDFWVALPRPPMSESLWFLCKSQHSCGGWDHRDGGDYYCLALGTPCMQGFSHRQCKIPSGPTLSPIASTRAYGQPSSFITFRVFLLLSTPPTVTHTFLFLYSPSPSLNHEHFLFPKGIFILILVSLQSFILELVES